MQMAQAKMQQEAQLEQVKLQLAQQEAATKAQIEAQRLEFEKWKAQLDNDTKVLIAELSSKTDLHKTTLNINADKNGLLSEVDSEGNESVSTPLQSLVDSINHNMEMMVAVNQQHNQDLAMQQQQAHEALIQQLTKPKTVIRDASGKIAGVQ